MGAAARGYLKKRLLKLQVGFLLAEGPGTAKEMALAFPERLQVESGLFVESLCGKLVLTRAKDGILLQGELRAESERECDRCLERFEHAFDLSLAELFLSPPRDEAGAFFVGSNGEIDLAPLLREEILIEESYRAVCREDCRGLSAETGGNLNYAEAAPASETLTDADAAIDPRLAVLKKLLR